MAVFLTLALNRRGFGSPNQIIADHPKWIVFE